jgi:hypothetical protein
LYSFFFPSFRGNRMPAATSGEASAGIESSTARNAVRSAWVTFFGPFAAEGPLAPASASALAVPAVANTRQQAKQAASAPRHRTSVEVVTSISCLIGSDEGQQRRGRRKLSVAIEPRQDVP